MTVIKKIFIFLCISFFFNNFILAQNHIFKSISAKSPFRCSFTQQLYEDNCLELEEKGYIIFKNIDNIRWEYTSPNKKICLIHNGLYKFYDKEMEQLSIGKIKENWFFHLIEKNKFKESKPYNFYYKDKVKGIIYKIICDENYLPLKVEQEDSLGFKTIYKLSDYKKVSELKKEYFLIKIPKNTEIINFN